MTAGEEKIFLCGFNLGFLGDMPQQNHLTGIKRQNAKKGCRQCEVPSAKYGDFAWDIHSTGRYHHDIVQFRSSDPSKAALGECGFNTSGPLTTELSPCADICRSNPADAPHSELAGMGGMMQELLFMGILKSNEIRLQYASQFRKLQPPAGWTRVQNPMHHRAS